MPENVENTRCSLRPGGVVSRANEDENRERDADFSKRSNCTSGIDVADTESRKSRKQESRDGWEGIGGGSEKVHIDRTRIKSERQFESGLGMLADGLPCWLDGYWRVEPNIPRVATGVKNRVDRLKCLGNAVVPQQAYPIFRAIAEIERSAE